VQTFELTGFSPASGATYFRATDLTSYDISARYPAPGTLGAVNHKLYQQLPADTSPTMRIVEQTRTLWFADDATVPATYLSAPLPLGVLGRRGLLCENYKLA